MLCACQLGLGCDTVFVGSILPNHNRLSLNFLQDGLAHEMLSGSRIALDTFAMRSQAPVHSFLVPLSFAAMVLGKELVHIAERRKKHEGDSM